MATVQTRAPPPQPLAREPHARLAYLDNLKLLMVAVIIAAHGALAYSTLASAWPYQDIQEVQLGAVSDTLVLMLVIPGVRVCGSSPV